MPEQPSRRRPLIAVIGSLDADRTDYDPPLRDLEYGEPACVELGHALAEAGCDLAVFSSKPKYVETWVVQGYAATTAGADRGRILIRPPAHAEVGFDLPRQNVELVVEPDTSGEWELPYYRAITTADGVVLVGGGRSTRVGGIVAILHSVPLVAMATFGGGAAYVRTNLARDRNDSTPEDITLMGQRWSDGLAHRLVASLLTQAARRRERLRHEAREAGHRVLAARVALTVAMLALVASWLAIAFVGTSGPPDPRTLVTVLATPMLAAVAGALLRNDRTDDPPWGWAAARGLGAGLTTVFLYIAGEFLSTPDLLRRVDPQRLLFFLVPLGFAAGFTFDLVFERLRTGQTKVPPSAPS